jgi:hypothetical protein
MDFCPSLQMKRDRAWRSPLGSVALFQFYQVGRNEMHPVELFVQEIPGLSHAKRGTREPLEMNQTQLLDNISQK